MTILEDRNRWIASWLTAITVATAFFVATTTSPAQDTRKPSWERSWGQDTEAASWDQANLEEVGVRGDWRAPWSWTRTTEAPGWDSLKWEWRG